MVSQLAPETEADILDLVTPGTVKVGRVVGWSVGRMPLVDFDGNAVGPLVARHLSSIGTRRKLDGASVLLVFENGDPTLPIVVGIIASGIAGACRTRHIKAHEIRLDAYERVVIRCGESCIEMTRDGKVTVRGVDVTSRASRTNRIKGSSVAIN